MTIQDLCKLEPLLYDLQAELGLKASEQVNSDTCCANAMWHGYDGTGVSLKKRLESLIGWHRAYKGDDPETAKILRSSDAYMLAVNWLYEMLPGCKDCSCLHLMEI
jgi:hypothetical protein